MTLPTKIKRILLEPDPRLTASNVQVTEGWEDLKPSVRLMLKAMYRTKEGVGLAAPQVGWNVRLFAMNPHRFITGEKLDQVFWNPRIAVDGEPVPMHEGCLSLPGVFGDVLRYPRVHMWADGPHGPVNGDYEGLAAQIIQHELDHLAGRLCIEHLRPQKTRTAP